MRLTALTIRTLALPHGVQDKTFFDGDLPGFGLRVRATGVKTWLVQYAVAGKTRRITLGSLDVLTAGAAREKAKDLMAQVRLGGDPAREKAAAREKAKETFGSILPRFLERQSARLKPRSYQETERHLLAHAKPLHGRPIEAVDRRSIAALLAKLAENRGPAASNRVRTSLSAFFAWSAREGYVEANPAAYTNKAVENGPRERVLTDKELAAIWRAAGDGQYGAIVKLLILTAARRDEIASLRWSEIDLEAATITLPPARTKNRREHVIPLSEPALAIIAAQPRRVDADGGLRDLVFGYGAGGFSDWSGSKADLNAAFDWNLHDFRRSISTALHDRFAVPPHVVEAILGHVSGHKAGVAGVYNKALYLDQRRSALRDWAAHIKRFVEA
jgi:integrase